MASEINNTFQTDYSSLTEQQKDVLNKIKDFNEITDEMLGFFPTTNTNLMSKTNEELNNILKEVKNMTASAPVHSPSGTSVVPSPVSSTVFNFGVPSPAPAPAPTPSSNIFSDPTTVIINEDMLAKGNNAPAQTFGGDKTKKTFKEFFNKHPYYHIYDAKGDGNCFFYVAQEALLGIDIRTTVHELRQLVSNEVTENTIAFYKDLYLVAPDKEKIWYTFIHKNNTVEKLKIYVLTNYYYADEFAISVIEKTYNVKFIVFSEEFDEKFDKDKLITCKENINSDNIKYILTSYTGNHYRLMTYKRQKILDTLPLEIIEQYRIDCLSKSNPP